MKLQLDKYTEKLDIMMYYGLCSIADNKLKKIDEELIPSFIIEEALVYFSEIEKYENCHKIKTYFKNNPSYVVQSSRSEWFGEGILNLK